MAQKQFEQVSHIDLSLRLNANINFLPAPQSTKCSKLTIKTLKCSKLTINLPRRTLILIFSQIDSDSKQSQL